MFFLLFNFFFFFSGKVIAVGDDLYRIGTSVGILNTWLPRNALTVTPYSFKGDIPKTYISVRQAATLLSNNGGQGYRKCNCKSRCDSNRCFCKKNKVLCNSRCHSSLSCSNKQSPSSHNYSSYHLFFLFSFFCDLIFICYLPPTVGLN